MGLLKDMFIYLFLIVIDENAVRVPDYFKQVYQNNKTSL